MGVLISDFFFLLYHYSVLRILQSSLLSKMKMRCVDSRLSKNYIFQNVRHPVKIFPRTSRERERETEKMKKEERKEIRSRFANTDNRQRSDCATPATVNHEGLQSLSPLSLSLSPMAEKRFEAVGVFNVGRCATARGHASYVPDNNDSVVLAVARPRESLHRGRLSADLDGNCSETTEETTLETGIPRYNEPRCRNES